MQLLQSARSLIGLTGLALLVAFLPISSTCAWSADFTVEDVLAKHLDSIGTAAVRAGMKSRVVQGGSTYRLLQGGSGAVDGKAVFAFEGNKTDILLKINANGFRGEQFICDGDKTSVAGTYLDKSRSEFGNFVL